MSEVLRAPTVNPVSGAEPARFVHEVVPFFSSLDRFPLYVPAHSS